MASAPVKLKWSQVFHRELFPDPCSSFCTSTIFLPISVRLFADDCLLHRAINTVQDQLILQKDLVSLEQWCITWGMKFNTKKC